MSAGCCFAGCPTPEEGSLRVELTPPTDGEPIVVWGHAACFERLRDPSVEHDDPGEHGRIPARARCAFCGHSLPLVGRHPLVFDVGDSPARRYWAHAECAERHFEIEEFGTSG